MRIAARSPLPPGLGGRDGLQGLPLLFPGALGPVLSELRVNRSGVCPDGFFDLPGEVRGGLGADLPVLLHLFRPFSLGVLGQGCEPPPVVSLEFFPALAGLFPVRVGLRLDLLDQAVVPLLVLPVCLLKDLEPAGVFLGKAFEGLPELPDGLLELLVEVPVLVGPDFPYGLVEGEVVLGLYLPTDSLDGGVGPALGGVLDVLVLLDVGFQGLGVVLLLGVLREVSVRFILWGLGVRKEFSVNAVRSVFLLPGPSFFCSAFTVSSPAALSGWSSGCIGFSSGQFLTVLILQPDVGPC